MQIGGQISRGLLMAVSLTFGLLGSPEAKAQGVNFHFHFAGTMSCMAPVPVSNAPISGDGAGTLNPDGSVTAEITQSLLVFSTALHFDSKLGSGVTSVPGGTGQVRVMGKQGLKFSWTLPNNTLVVNVAVRGNSCSATFAANLLPGKSQYTFYDGAMYHYCGRPAMTTSSCEIR